MYKNQRVLITGGAGFIGSHIAEKLVAQGAQITILDNLSTGSLDNLSTIVDKVTFKEGDITAVDDCLKATEHQDVIFHCAALVSVPDAEAHPNFCFETNIQGTFNILEAARINNVDRFIFSSSAAVYGPQTEPCHEGMACIPTSVYGYSKLIGELLCKQFFVRNNVKTVILRYFNVFGDRQNAKHPYAGVVAKFQHALKNNLPITLFGDGSQTRDFVSVHEVAHANLIVGALPDNYWHADVYNIGTGTSISLNNLLNQLKAKNPSYNQEIQYAPPRPGDIYTSAAMCSKYLKIKEEFLL